MSHSTPTLIASAASLNRFFALFLAAKKSPDLPLESRCSHGDHVELVDIWAPISNSTGRPVLVRPGQEHCCVHEDSLQHLLSSLVKKRPRIGFGLADDCLYEASSFLLFMLLSLSLVQMWCHQFFNELRHVHEKTSHW